jgi:hypothetical protein
MVSSPSTFENEVTKFLQNVKNTNPTQHQIPEDLVPHHPSAFAVWAKQTD